MTKNTGSRKRLHDILTKINRTEEDKAAPADTPEQKPAVGGGDDFDVLKSMVGRKDQLKITDLIRDPREMGPISDKGPEEREAQQYQDISHEDAGEEPESLETPVGAPVIDPENLEALKSVVDALFREEKTAEIPAAEEGGIDPMPALSGEALKSVCAALLV